MDKWEELKTSVIDRFVSVEQKTQETIEETRREALAEIETAKNDSILAEVAKITSRLDRIEARLPAEED